MEQDFISTFMDQCRQKSGLNILFTCHDTVYNQPDTYLHSLLKVVLMFWGFKINLCYFCPATINRAKICASYFFLGYDLDLWEFEWLPLLMYGPPKNPRVANGSCMGFRVSWWVVVNQVYSIWWVVQKPIEIKPQVGRFKVRPQTYAVWC